VTALLPGAALAVLFQAAQAPTLSLEEALKIAEANAFRVRLAASDLEKARQQHAESKGRRGPSLQASASYTRFDKEISAQFNGSSVTIRPIDQKQASLTFSVPLDVSKALSKGVDAARLNALAFEASLASEKSALKLEVRRAYFGAVQARWQVGVAEEALENSRKRLENAELRQRAGELAKVDVLRFQTEVAQRASELIAAKNGLSLAKNVLNNAMGRPIQTLFETEEIERIPAEPAGADTLVLNAAKARPELDALRFTAESLKRVREAEERGLAPTLNLSAVHDRAIDAQGFGSTEGTTTGTLTLAVPIFDSGITRARARAARQDEEQAKIRLAQFELGVSLEVRQALTSLVDAKSRLKVADEQVKLAEETYRLAVLRYEAGEGIQLEALDAQTQLTQARTGLVAARYDVLAAHAQLQAAVGRDDLGAAGANTEKKN